MSEEADDISDKKHPVEVIEVKLEKHSNADTLSVVRIYDYTCIVQTKLWEGVTKGAWIPPDSLVDTTRDEFKFLADKARADGYYRVKAIRLRGTPSFGLLVPAPEGSNVGDDVVDVLGVKHYEPAIPGVDEGGKDQIIFGGESCSAPPLPYDPPKYDIAAFRKYARKVFANDARVVVTEKVHGTSSRYVCMNDIMYCGSRTTWKREFPTYNHITVEYLKIKGKTEEEANAIIAKLKSSEKAMNLWWKAYHNTPAIDEFCRANQGVLLYGEVYGVQKGMRYGVEPGQVSFAAFDIKSLDGRWLSCVEAYELGPNLPWVPHYNDDGSVFTGHFKDYKGVEFDIDKITAMAEGNTVYPGGNHIKEGVVVKAFEERWDESIHRAHLKIHGVGFSERKQ